MGRDLLGGFEGALVLEVGGDARRTESMAADAGLDTGGGRTSLDHAVSVLLPHGIAGKLTTLASRGAEHGPLQVIRDSGGCDVLVEVLFEIVVARHLVDIALKN